MMIFKPMNRLTPVELYQLLEDHGLVPVNIPFERLMVVVQNLATNGAFGMVLDENDLALAATITFVSEPGILTFHWIPEVKQLHKRKDELSSLALQLRPFWFHDGVRRVEARSPYSRTQTVRALKGLGFRQETLDCGLRATIDYGRGYEGTIILGMLEGDALRHIVPTMVEGVVNA